MSGSCICTEDGTFIRNDPRHGVIVTRTREESDAEIRRLSARNDNRPAAPLWTPWSVGKAVFG